jgi:hypothetical protein
LRDVDNVDNPSKMSSRAMRKLQGENLEQELEKIHMKTEEADVDSNEEEDYDVGGGGGGARPKQRRNPFEMVGTVGGAARVEQLVSSTCRAAGKCPVFYSSISAPTKTRAPR